MKSTARSGFVFSQVPRAEIPRSVFRRDHGYKTTFNEGLLVPFYADEVLPGDTFKVRVSIAARLSTLLFPLMDNVFIDVFFFYTPLRLLWVNFQKFMGEQVNPGDSTSFNTPVVDLAAAQNTALSLWDYLGLPVGKNMRNGQPNETPPVAFWSRAYNLIWNQWFRDENLQNSATVDTGDGPDTAANYVLKSRGMRHDYFSSCLPWPQKGTGVNLPLGSSAPVKGLYLQGGNNNAQDATGGFDSTGAVVAANKWVFGGTNLRAIDHTQTGPTGGSATHYPEIYADLTAATAATINQLRQAFQLQRLQERDARGGTRYREILLSHFGVVSPDARLQRPEFLGGGTLNMSTQVVAQTSATGLTGGNTAKGSLAAYGEFGGGGLGFVKSFVEHGVLLGLVAVRGDVTYQQGLHKMFTRRTRFDFYWPALAHIGEQDVKNYELYYNADANDALPFGYQERWAEYRYKPSVVTGAFRSSYATPLDTWHLARKFTTLPTLGDTFIKDAPPLDRVVAVTTEPRVILDSYFQVETARPMPVYSVPGKIDHF